MLGSGTGVYSRALARVGIDSLPGTKSLIFLISWPSQVQSMKQTNSSLRQALEGGIDPLRPPEVRLLFGLGFSLEAEQKGHSAGRAGPPSLCF